MDELGKLLLRELQSYKYPGQNHDSNISTDLVVNVLTYLIEKINAEPE